MIDREIEQPEEEEREPMPTPIEKKSARFAKNAPRRVTQALVAIGRVGRIGNRLLYAYTDADRDAIFDALDEALLVARAKFDPPAAKPPKPATTFELPKREAPAFEGEG